jgi:endonuclease/exonuclease/phosphatase family metal-dependent hydrolase
MGYPFFMAGISFDSGEEPVGKNLSVLSYNVKGFVSYKADEDREVFDFIDNLETDISCFQEFYNQGKYVQKLKKTGKYDVIHSRLKSNLAIVSKFPVLRHGLLLEDSRYNNIMYADILVEDEDTIRIYNVHLESMGITHTNSDYYEDLVTEYGDAKNKFLEGTAVRTGQINTLLSHAENCAYPIIIVGDFNDVPFSYNYFKVRRTFKNSFEEVGSGFGFTYNGDLPFLRIDNQFFNEGFEANSFETLDSVVYSDHYPTLGIYSISD